ncbi:DUF2393 domain-containing protein [Sulfurimonas sp.]|uniref:DUF2393 domain-containing protein n=1 Tax=Sulfurimonas sp. TaxID=2022749 RepID=UPI0025FB43D6|nr:DUF2393 domain-containing protein [Sulfurimonas sp.]MDD5157502.1 DUF2393 domain-containing protein [Sulfurimonas sp.]
MSGKINAFIYDLVLYDYILFGVVFFLFIFFVILGIVARRRTYIAIPLVLIAFATLILGPTLGYVEMHNYLYKNKTTIINQKKLTFTKAIVLNGSVKNESNRDFKRCKITAKVFKSTKNEIKDFIFSFKPINKMTIIENSIAINEERDFKMIVEPFTYLKDYTLFVEADCR